MNSTELIYRKTAAQGADGFGLLIALYDTLAGNLKRAAEAERRSDIEARCNEANHALLIIGYLQDGVERSSGGELSQRLIVLYSSLRKTIMEAQFKRSAGLLEQKMELVLSVREMWQDLETRAAERSEFPASTIAVSTPLLPADRAGSSSWSA